ncbi:hypothetical protein [Microbacterium sp. PI-1]|uniref:arsenate reductase/protein-tyrosine-phosphatase family protein n=1 Tax=Microbacterium sp. PI-1 TaxID=2545631 RepID=UPI001404A972|nr:hypothetical protein [Microbacterium sp. PI-1]
MTAPTPGELAARFQAERRETTPPAALRAMFADPSASLDVLGVVLMASWRHGAPTLETNGHPRPLLALPRGDWAAMFRRVGYMANIARAPEKRPAEPLRLYRVATPDYRDGLSWALSLADARVFLRSPSALDHRLYVADVEPAWMLGHWRTGFPFDVPEIVADVPRSAIRPYVARPGEPYRVMFVCWGNICRSALAALILRRMAEAHGVPVIVASSGTAANHGDAMDAGTLATAARHGLDGSDHAARRFYLDDLREHDLVVSLDPGASKMTRGLSTMPSATARVWDRPVPNPWRRPDDEHESAYRLLADVCAEVLADVLDHLRPEGTR